MRFMYSNLKKILTVSGFFGLLIIGGCGESVYMRRAAEDSYGLVGCPENQIMITSGVSGSMGYYKSWVATCNGKKFYCKVPPFKTRNDIVDPPPVCAREVD